MTTRLDGVTTALHRLHRAEAAVIVTTQQQRVQRSAVIATSSTACKPSVKLETEGACVVKA